MPRHPFARFASLVRSFGRDRSGTIAVTGVCFCLVAVALVAIVTDWGSMFLTKRDQQGTTDLAALIAARNLTKASVAANAVIAANGVSPSAPVEVVLGRYTPDRTLPVAQRFVANAMPTNAVSVKVSAATPLFFGRLIAGTDTVPVVTQATATTTSLAAFGIGSRLASLDGGVLNQLLDGMLGGHLSLSAMDYRALADANVEMFGFLDQLAGAAQVTGGTYDQLAATDVSVGDVLAAMTAAGVTGPSASTAEAALNIIGRDTDAAHMTIPAGELFDLGPYGALTAGEGAGLDANLRAFELLGAAAAIANGDHQVELALGGGVPGLADLTASVIIGERPQHSSWVAIGDEGATVHTAQTRIRLDATVGGSGLLAGTQIRVPILIDLASARGELSDVQCGDDPATDAFVVIDATPSAADLWIGEPTAGWTSFAAPTVQPATLLSVPLLARVTGSAHTAVANTYETPVTFDADDIAAHTIKTVSTTTPISSALTSLIGETDITVQALGLGIGTGAIGNLVESLVAPIGPALDPLLLSLLDPLGVRIGEADLTVDGVRCDGSVLVR